jgi:hypothetical protein
MGGGVVGGGGSKSSGSTLVAQSGQEVEGRRGVRGKEKGERKRGVGNDAASLL